MAPRTDLSEQPNWKITGEQRIRGDGRDLVLKTGNATFDTLYPDSENRRLFAIRKSTYNDSPLTPDQCYEELWKMNSVKQLYQSVVTTGGLTEALWVQPDGVVKEGNERLTALFRIHFALEKGDIFDEEETGQFNTLLQNIPVWVLPADITNKESAQLLASAHLGGKHEWDPVVQASELWDMNNIHGITATEIAYILRKSRTWVHQRLKAYEWSQEYFDRHQKWDKPKDFSYFEELYKKRNALLKCSTPFDVEDTVKLHQFMDWVSDGQIPRALEVRKLPKILEHEQTRELLYAGEGIRAFEELKFVDAAENSPRFAAIERMSTQLDRMTWDEYRQISEKPDFRKIIEDSIERLGNILQVVDGAFGGNKE